LSNSREHTHTYSNSNSRSHSNSRQDDRKSLNYYRDSKGSRDSRDKSKDKDRAPKIYERKSDEKKDDKKKDDKKKDDGVSVTSTPNDKKKEETKKPLVYEKKKPEEIKKKAEEPKKVETKKDEKKDVKKVETKKDETKKEATKVTEVKKKEEPTEPSETLTWSHTPKNSKNLLLQHTHDIFLNANDPDPDASIKNISNVTDRARRNKVKDASKTLCDVIFEFHPNLKNPEKSCPDGYFVMSSCLSAYSYKFRRYVLENRYLRAMRSDGEEESHYSIIRIPDLFEVAIEPVLEFFHSGELTFSKKDISEILRLLLYFDANIDKNDYKEIAKLAKVKLFYSNEKGFLTKEEKEGKVYEKSMAQAKLAKDNLMLKRPELASISDEAVEWDCMNGYGVKKTNHHQKETNRTQNSQP